MPTTLFPPHFIRSWSGHLLLSLLFLGGAHRSGCAEAKIEAAEMTLVRQLRERILAQAEKSSGAPAQSYVESIAGTEVKFTMLPIPAGSFTLGSLPEEKGRNPDEGPQRKITLPGFWMGKCEVTWNEYEVFMFASDTTEAAKKGAADAVSHPTKPYVEMSFGMGRDGFPAISITQHAANKYCEWLSAKTGHFYRLPTEAEWEYAARAGTTTAYSFGDDPALLAHYACFKAEQYAKVGSRKPNPWGLHDMHGNVLEWTLDQYLPDAYARLSNDSSRGTWVKSTQPYPHVARGGSWNDPAPALRSAARRASSPDWKELDPQLPKSVWYHTSAPWIGFRVVRQSEIPSAEEMYRYWNNGVAEED